MPRKISVTDNQLISELQSLFGPELTAGDIKGFCASRGMNYQTVTRRLDQFKVSRGRWNPCPRWQEESEGLIRLRKRKRETA